MEPNVFQYRQAAEAAQRFLTGGQRVDPDQADVGAKLAQASLVLAIGRRSLTVARERVAGRPIVFCMVLGVNSSDLDAAVTGVPLEPDPKSVLSDLQKLSPAIRRVGLVFNPKSNELLARRAESAARDLGVVLVARALEKPTEVKEAINGLAKQVDAIWLPPDPKLFNTELFSFMLGFSAERRLPVVGFLESFTQAGALASVSPNYAEDGALAGKLAAEILARPEGHRLPVPAPIFATGNLSLNLKTAKAFGIEISAKATADATQVFR